MPSPFGTKSWSALQTCSSFMISFHLIKPTTMAPTTIPAEKGNALHSVLGQFYILAHGLAKHRLASVVFAKLLEESLTAANAEKSLAADIYNKIETAVSIRNAAAASKRVELDKKGTKLWNLSSKLKRTTMDGEMFCLGKDSPLLRFCFC